MVAAGAVELKGLSSKENDEVVLSGGCVVIFNEGGVTGGCCAFRARSTPNARIALPIQTAAITMIKIRIRRFLVIMIPYLVKVYL